MTKVRTLQVIFFFLLFSVDFFLTMSFFLDASWEWSVQADNIKNTKEINSIARIIFNNMFLTK